MESENECESILCPNCITKRRLFLEYAIKKNFCNFKLNVIYKREDLIFDLIDNRSNFERYQFCINTIKQILEKVEKDNSPIFTLFNEKINELNKKVSLEIKEKNKLNSQLDLLYDLLKEDEDELFDNLHSENEDSDEEDNDEDYNDDNSETNSDTPTEIDRR